MLRSVLVGLLVARIASAQAPQVTREFQAGVDAFRLGHFDEARAHLEKARAIDPKLPGPHRFLAAVAQAQGRWQDCIDDAREALAVAPQSPEAPETRTLYEQCRGSAGRPPYRGPELGDSAAIAVTTNIPGATVKIGGLLYGGTPLAPRPITAGPLELDLAKPGWKPGHAIVTALAGIVTDVAIELEPDPAAKPAELEVNHVAQSPGGWLEVGCVCTLAIDGEPVTAGGPLELTPGVHVVEAHAPDHDPWRRRVRISAGQKTSIEPQLVRSWGREYREHLGLAMVGGGGMLLVAGFAFALASEHATAEAREIDRVETARDPTQPLSATAAIEPVHTRADFEAARARATRWAIASDVAYGTALAAAAVGAFYLHGGRRERADLPPPFAVNIVVGGAVVSKAVVW